MSTQSGANLYGAGVGTHAENVEIPVISTVTPASTNIGFPLGKRWINKSTNAEYVLTSETTSSGTTTATWTLLGTNTGALNTLSDGSVTVSPAAGNIAIDGTANQITSTGNNGAASITLSLPATLIAPGSLEVTGLLKGDAGCTINTAGTAANIATDNDTAAVNIGNGTSARTISIGTTSGVKTIDIGDGVSGNTISLGGGANSSPQTINIANGASGANSTVNVLSGAGTAGTQTLNVLGSGATRAGAINLGTGAAAHVITLGSSSAGNITSTIASGSTYAVVGSGGTIHVGADAAANVITVGSTTGAASLSLKCGTGNFNLDGAATSTYTIAPSTTSGTINIGGTGANTGTMTIAGGTGAQAVAIADSTGGKTVTIATGAGANTVTLGSTNTTSATTINSGSGNVTIAGGNLKINSAGKQLQVHSGAVTDFAGQLTLTNGVATVLNTNIAAADQIILTRSAKNASTAYGTPTTSITAATSFTVTSQKSDTTTEVNDQSTYDYMIIRRI